LIDFTADAGLFFHDIVRLGINRQPHVALLDSAEQGIDLGEGRNFVSPHFDAICHIVVGREDLNHVAAHPERPTTKIALGTLVKNLDQLAGDVLPLDFSALFQETSSMP
jgi:hypothetical protein